MKKENNMNHQSSRITMEMNPMDIFTEPTLVMDINLQKELRRISSFPVIDKDAMLSLEEYIEAITVRVIVDEEEIEE